MSPESALDEKPRLHLVRVYPVACEKVWRAWTDPQALSSWFGPGDTQRVESAALDVRVGGSYHIRFFTEDGLDHDVAGTYQEVVPHRRLSFTWAWKSTPDRVSLVTIALRPVDGGTELDFVHERFFDAQARDNHARGWNGALAKLDALLAD